MKRVVLQPEVEAWRDAAREAMRQGYRPEEIDLQDASPEPSPAPTFALENRPTGIPVARPYTTKGFLEDAAMIAAHRSPARWNLLYRVLYRLQENRNLLKIQTDVDVVEMLRLAAQVRGDLQKMYAFVRFRKVMKSGEVLFAEHRPEVIDEEASTAGDIPKHRLMLATGTPFGASKTDLKQCEQPKDEECEHFVAWYRPDNRILALAAPFFTERYSILRWSILTPDASVSWDPGKQVLSYGAGVIRESTPDEEELEMMWRRHSQSLKAKMKTSDSSSSSCCRGC